MSPGNAREKARHVRARYPAASAHLWVLEGNTRARRFYERRGWREDGTTHVVDYPPHPVDVGSSREL